MADIKRRHDQIKEAVSGQTTDQFRHLLMDQIDQWEQQSIDKIHRVANDTRQQLLITVRDRGDNLKEKMIQLTQQLEKACRDGEFFENELRDWSEKLNKFQQIFIEQQQIQIHEDQNSAPFISKISLNDTSKFGFAQPMNALRYEERNNENYSPSLYEDYSDLREKGDYSSGEHSLRFKIEQYEPSHSILFGIVSKYSSEDPNSYENPTFYGWTGKNTVYLGGSPRHNYKGYKSDIRANDIFMLKMNCDQEMISLTNERTSRTYDLKIDTNKCPFPWQPHVRFLINPE